MPPKKKDAVAKISLADKLRMPKVGEMEFDNAYSDATQYGRPEFWDEYFSKETEAFEWYVDYFAIQSIVHEYIPDTSVKVMVAGCGNSHLMEDMADDEYENIIAADQSRVVISQLQVRCRDYPEISFFQGTMCDTNLPEGSIDAVIDKGLLDSILCGQNGPINVSQYIVEVERILSDTGVFILISHGNPETRIGYLEQIDIDEPFYLPWVLDVQTIMKMKEREDEQLDLDDPDSMYFVYICVKNETMVTNKKIKENKIKMMNKKRRPKKTGAPML